MTALHKTLATAVLCALATACAHNDPQGLTRLESTFNQTPSSAQKPRADFLLALARQGRHADAVKGLQTLRLHPNLIPGQLTAIQDAIGQIQTQLATAALRGDTNAARHIRALQSETEPFD